MSYDKIKSIKYNKKTGECFITGACSNLFPIQYSRWEKPLNIYKVFAHTMTGDFHILPSCKKWYFLTNLVKKWSEGIIKDGLFLDYYEHKDFKPLVDRALALNYSKLNKVKYHVIIQGEFVVKFHQTYCETAWTKSGAKEIDFITLMANKDNYNRVRVKRVA